MDLKEMYKSIDGDYEGTLDRLGGNPSLLKKFLIKFSHDSVEEMIRKNVDAGQLEEIFQYAHTLKGVSGNLGLSQLYIQCEKMVSDIREGKNDTYQNNFLLLDKEYQKVIDAISQL